MNSTLDPHGLVSPSVQEARDAALILFSLGVTGSATETAIVALNRLIRALKVLDIDPRAEMPADFIASEDSASTVIPLEAPVPAFQLPPSAQEDAEDDYRYEVAPVVELTDIQKAHFLHGAKLASQIRQDSFQADELKALRELEKARKPPRKSILTLLKKKLSPTPEATPMTDTLSEARVEVAELPEDLSSIPEPTEPANFPEAPTEPAKAFPTEGMGTKEAKSYLAAETLTREELNAIIESDPRKTIQNAAQKALTVLLYSKNVGWPLLAAKAVGKGEGTVYAAIQACESATQLEDALFIEEAAPDLRRKTVIKYLKTRISDL